MAAEQAAPREPSETSNPGLVKESGTRAANEKARFPVVGIGASAGGLEAFKQFLSNMPTGSGVAIVLVPHLDPTRESSMVELLSRQTTMPVCEAKDNMAIEPNHVYVIPPNKYLAVVDGTLQLSSPPQHHRQPTAIDFFLRSLAAALGERAIGIILSGTSSHGTPGLKAIKASGGMAMAQAPESAQYDQMPRSAIATGMVDFVLPPEQMPQTLLQYIQHVDVHGESEQSAEAASVEQLDGIVNVLRSQTKYDFGGYRKNMLMRRALRRMGICRLKQLSDYRNYLRDNADEVTALCKDLLVGVTEFFRDGEAFDVLKQRIIPELVATRDSIRVWVPACATGEEPYSIGILFLEEFTEQTKPAAVNVFATDIDETSLATARQGIYAESSVTEISPERLQRFFVKLESNQWRVSKALRERLTFARQNLITDAPFSKLDFISCRNLLIYLEPDLQAKLIRMFHFALVDGGYLLIGPSESIGRETHLFEPVSRKWRLFRRKPGARRRAEIPIVGTDAVPRPRGTSPELGLAPVIGFTELTRRVILEDYAPAAALINHQMEVLSVLGPLVKYLEFPPGDMTRDLLALARPGLRAKLRAAINKAIRTGQTVIDRSARVKRDRAYASCSFKIRPVADSRNHTALLMVTFQDREPAQGGAPAQSGAQRAEMEDDAALLQLLDQELAATRHDLQSTVEAHESATEELKASNEEVMSMNEELQSANEELETSKEELQSLNEELNTVNNELQEKVEELDRSNSDLVNLMASSEIATVFLDGELRIRRFTSPALKLLNLRPTDLDRPLGDLALKLDDERLLDDCRTVLDQSTPIEREVWTKHAITSTARPVATQRPDDARCYLRRVLPYQSGDDHHDGVVITLIDITERIVALEAMRQQQELNEAIINTAQYIILLLDSQGRILRFNAYMENLTGWQFADVAGRDWFDTFIPERDREQIRELFARALSGKQSRGNVNPIVTRDGEERDIEWFDATLTDAQGKLIGILCTGQDVTERKRADAVLKEREERMRAILNTASDAIITIDNHGRMTSINPATVRMFGYTDEELLGQHVSMLTPLHYRDEHDENYIVHYLQIGEPLMSGNGCELVGRRKDGSTFPMDLALSQVDRLGLFTAVVRDISHRKNLEKQVLQIAVDEQRRIGQELHDGTGQELTGLSLFAGTLVDLLNDAPSEISDDGVQGWTLTEGELTRLRQTASRLSQGLASAHEHVTQLSHGIMPVQIEAGGLTSALQELAAVTNSHGKIRCRFNNPSPVEIANTSTATHLYRVAQEAVNNALRHSRADEIQILLSQTDNQIVLEVRDNGVSFDAASSSSVSTGTRGIGLDIMSYRAGILGGTLQIASLVDGGTSIKCIIPSTGGG